MSENFFEAIASLTPTCKRNPWWTMEGGIIHDEMVDRPLDLSWRFGTLLETVRAYFREMYRHYKTEAQVVVIARADYQHLVSLNLDTRFTVIDYLGDQVIIVPPQTNTYGTTEVSTDWWGQVLMDQNITPVMRIHSHHVMDAYQSITDWESLNSWTLEVVIGHVESNDYAVAYWLDEQGKDTKDTHYRIENFVSDPYQIRVHKRQPFSNRTLDATSLTPISH